MISERTVRRGCDNGAESAVDQDTLLHALLPSSCCPCCHPDPTALRHTAAGYLAAGSAASAAKLVRP